jgi:hypothetical protein
MDFTKAAHAAKTKNRPLVATTTRIGEVIYDGTMDKTDRERCGGMDTKARSACASTRRARAGAATWLESVRYGGSPSMAFAATAHPACALFPPTSPEEFAQLKADIAEKGILVPVVIWRPIEWTRSSNPPWQLLDGQNRLDASEALGKPTVREDGIPLVPYREYQADDPEHLVVSLNLARRHLSIAQKRYIAGELLKLDSGRSDRAIGADVQLSPTTVGKIREQVEQEQVSKNGHLTRAAANNFRRFAARARAFSADKAAA